MTLLARAPSNLRLRKVNLRRSLPVAARTALLPRIVATVTMRLIPNVPVAVAILKRPLSWFSFAISRLQPHLQIQSISRRCREEYLKIAQAMLGDTDSAATIRSGAGGYRKVCGDV
jgi:hypothetical protein